MVDHLYLHIPFCAKVCPYCCFYVHGGGVPKQERFIEALLMEMKELDFSQPVKTIFVGGGTPSMLMVSLIERLAEGFPPLKSGGRVYLGSESRYGDGNEIETLEKNRGQSDQSWGSVVS